MPARIHLRAPLVEGATVELPPAESRHVQVLRLQPGDGLVLFDGERELEWPAEIVRIERSRVIVRLGVAQPVDREMAVRVTLAIGIPANERMDGLVEKAVELGAGAIQPLICARSVVRLSGDRAEARRRHWSAVASSASEQCGRTRVPDVAMPLRLDAWLHGIGGVEPASKAHSRRWLLSFARDALPPAAYGLEHTGGRPNELVILSGPEGGLAPDEEAAALAQGFDPVSLGARVLRADTAPLALLAWLGIALLGSGP